MSLDAGPGPPGSGAVLRSALTCRRAAVRVNSVSSCQSTATAASGAKVVGSATPTPGHDQAAYFRSAPAAATIICKTIASPVKASP